MEAKSAGNVTAVPLLTVQHDFNRDLADVLSRRVPNAKFWLSLYGASGPNPSLHGSISVSPEPGSLTSVAVKADLPEFRLEYLDPNSVSFSYLPGGQDATRVQAPMRVFTSQNVPKPIDCLDLSPAGDMVLVGGGDGALKILDAKDGSLRRNLEGHKADVECCKFFPSGKVALSGGLDLTIRIWDVSDGQSPVQLKNHTRGILDLAIVSRGRNILSCSRDGTLLLQEPASASVIRKIAALSEPINRIVLGTRPEGDWAPLAMDSKEVDTEGKIVWAACQDGKLRSWDLGSKDAAFSASPTGSALTAVAYSTSNNLVACGSALGEIAVFDVRNMSPRAEASSPVMIFKRNTAEISSLAFLDAPKPGLLVSTSDGQCYVVADPQNLSSGAVPHVATEMIGADVEAINCTASRTAEARGTEVFAGAKDGALRKYLVRS